MARRRLLPLVGLLALGALAGRLQRAPVRPPLRLQPLGSPRADALACLAAELGRDYSVILAPPRPIPSIAWRPARGQYDAAALLRLLGETSPPVLTLAVAEVDATVAGVDYVLGLAERPGRRALVCLPRLAAGATPDQWRHRLVAVARHELGHTRGLRHCPRRRCVMAFAATPAAVDAGGENYCPACRAGATERSRTNRPGD